MSGSTLDDDLHLVANQHRRLVLRYLVNESPSPVLIDEFVEYIFANSSTEHAPSRAATKNELHHRHLPKLADHNIVEYDPKSGDVWYRSHDRIETLLECIPRD